MDDKDIFTELQFISKDRESDVFIQKWKMDYLSDYISYWNINEIDEDLDVWKWEYTRFNWFYWNFEISDKWKYFIKKFDNSYTAIFDNYLWRYPNISKLFYFILWIIVWLAPTIAIFIKQI